MASIKVSTRLSIVDTQSDKTTRAYEREISFTEAWRREIVLVTGTTAVLWDPVASSLSPSAFVALAIASEVDIDVEMTINEGDANEELNSLRVRANVPLVLGADDAYDNHGASDVYAGSLSIINKIRARNDSGADGTVLIFVGN